MTQPSNNDQPAVAAAVIVRGGRVLLVRRRLAEGSLSWQFPAGVIEAGETPQEAAVRETSEETGLVVAAMKVLGERVHPSTGRRMIYVACDLLAGDAEIGDQNELAELSWSSTADMRRLVPHGFFGPVQDYLDTIMAS